MIPHKSRSYRTILDLSFKLMVDNKELPSVNENTSTTAPQYYMKELGRVLEIMVSLMDVAPSNSPDFLFSKLDIKDVFWRLKVTQDDSWIFCYVLSSITGTENINIDDIHIVVPDSLQMGWTESPPFFCSATETARDIAEKLINEGTDIQPHPLESMCLPPQNWNNDESGRNCENLISYLEVYVDDFILMIQYQNRNGLKSILRRVLHAVYCIFLPPTVSKHNGEDLISIKS